MRVRCTKIEKTHRGLFFVTPVSNGHNASIYLCALAELLRGPVGLAPHHFFFLKINFFCASIVCVYTYFFNVKAVQASLNMHLDYSPPWMGRGHAIHTGVRGFTRNLSCNLAPNSYLPSCISGLTFLFT